MQRKANSEERSLEKQILLPLRIRPAHKAHDVPAGVQVESAGLARELHVGLIGQHVSLPAIAVVAAGDEVLPRRCSAARAWDDVVERKFPSCENLAAILAGVAIAQQDVLARESAGLVRNATIFEQPDDRRNIDGDAGSVKVMAVGLFHHGDSLEHQYDGAACRAHVDGLIGSVQYQYRRMHRRARLPLVAADACVMHASCQGLSVTRHVALGYRGHIPYTETAVTAASTPSPGSDLAN